VLSYVYYTKNKTVKHINDLHSFEKCQGLGLWCLTSFSTIFQLYRDSTFTGRGNRSTRRNHQPAQVIDKLYHIMLYRVHLAMSGIRTHNFSGGIH